MFAHQSVSLIYRIIRRSIHYCMLVALLILLVSCRAAEREELQSVSLVVTNGMVIDGTGADPITDGLVAIQGNRIVAVGPAADFEIPDEAVVIDAEGGTILPGIINSHVHNVAGVGTRRVSFLLDGVTSVCDLGIPLARMPEFEQESMESGLAARGFKAGPVITAPGGYPGPWLGSAMTYEIQGEDEAEDAVLDLQAQEADYIKVVLEPSFDGETLPVITLEELRSVVETAHENDLLVRVHVTQSAMLGMALDAGVDVLEHVPMPSESLEDLEPMFDDAGVFQLPSGLEAQLLRMIDQGVVLVPTLEVYAGGFYNPVTDVYMQALFGVVRFFHDSGGIIALGNDYGNPGTHSGMPLDEMELLLEAGLYPLEIIEASTRHAAYVCGQGDDLGTLESGKLADLIVVDGDPLDDLSAMDSVLYIVKDGELVFSP